MYSETCVNGPDKMIMFGHWPSTGHKIAAHDFYTLTFLLVFYLACDGKYRMYIIVPSTP